jgi:predicted CoA-binding protein
MTTEFDMQSAARLFFTSPHIAVAGASSSPHKFGYKIFAWYLLHNLTPVPINPSCPSITVHGKDFTTISSPSQLAKPTETSLSVITPPNVTKELLKEAKTVGVRSVWLQPGTFTDDILEWAKKEWPGAVAGGFEKGTRGGEGWCVLVDGEKAMRDAAKEQKL